MKSVNSRDLPKPGKTRFYVMVTLGILAAIAVAVVWLLSDEPKLPADKPATAEITASEASQQAEAGNTFPPIEAAESSEMDGSDELTGTDELAEPPVEPAETIALTGSVEPAEEILERPIAKPAPVVAVDIRDFELESGQALVGALQEQGITREEAGLVAIALEPVFEARKLRAGQSFKLALASGDETPQIQSLAFRVGIDQEIVIEWQGESFVAEERPIPYERRVEARMLTVSNSLAAAATSAEVPQEPILEIMQQLQHQVDFNRDLRSGDEIELTYERFIHPEEGLEHIGGLLSARLWLGDKPPLEIYRYTTADGVISFYDGEGVSIETELARTPVVGGFLTSNYGPRIHPLLGVARMHKGMDFAAPKGSAVVAVRGGRVMRASRNGSFGNYVRIDHGDGLETAYAHLSDYADGLEEGVRVKKGDVIGYVGESGLATSPNLHYEVLQNGKQIDPRAIELPPRIKLQGAELARFRQMQQDLKAVLAEQDNNEPKSDRG